MLSIKLIQILQKLGKQNGYHLLNTANVERNLQNNNINQNPGFKGSIKKVLHPSFVTYSNLILFLDKLVNSFGQRAFCAPILDVSKVNKSLQILTLYSEVYPIQTN